MTYTQGALRYVFQTTQPNWGEAGGSNLGFGVIADAVTGGIIGPPINTAAAAAASPAQSLELVTAWNVNAAYEHFWSPRWRTSLYGGYAEVSYGGNSNALMCAGIPGQATVSATGVITVAGGCNMDWNTWWVGSRTQWNITKDFYMGVDVMYSKLESGSLAGGILTTGTGAITPALGNGTPVFINNPDNWSFRFRVHRDFYP